MRITLGLVIAASGFLAVGATAQMAAPPPPPPGGGMMRADANRDGIVTRAEMIAEAEARFTAMDGDRDGTVTAAERDAAREAMRAQWRGGNGGNRGGGPRGGGMGMRGDPDGVLTRAETVQRAGARFDRLDTNRDGKLDAAELAAARPGRGPRGGGAIPPAPAQ
ncbi:hypothetical protein NF700_01090 [Sphingomonadaceae bacterium OTU29MARTA1]|nr:hypothetical protein NF700_01090 [Sphingomonadaceae bacterium OTU29MARTA1]